MDPKILWLIILTLVQIIFLLVKNKKEKAPNNPGKYGERIAALEKGQKNIEGRLRRIDGILNGTYRK